MTTPRQLQAAQLWRLSAPSVLVNASHQDSIFLFVLSVLLLLSLPVHLLLVLHFWQEFFLIHAAVLPSLFHFLFIRMHWSWAWRRWCLNIYWPALLDPCSLQSLFPWDSSKKILEEAKVFSPEIQDFNCTYCPASSVQGAELQIVSWSHCTIVVDLLEGTHTMEILLF